jgi:PadR family transcriptional regulator PadR
LTDVACRAPIDKDVAALLRALQGAHRLWSYGYELAALAQLPSDRLYLLLIELEKHRLVEAGWQDCRDACGSPRHAYRLTAAGERLAQAAAHPPVGREAGHEGGDAMSASPRSEGSDRRAKALDMESI